MIGAMLMPVLFGIIFKVGLPTLEGVLGKSFYALYPAIDMILSMLAPTLTSVAFATVMLEEIDDKIATFYCVTPFGKSGYFITRIGIPIVVSSIANFIILSIFSLMERSPAMTFTLIVMGAFQAVMVSFIVVALSANKVEGMTVARLATTMLITMFFPLFIHGWLQYTAAIIPAFWMGKALHTQQPLYVLISVVESVVWIWILAKRVMKKLEV